MKNFASFPPLFLTVATFACSGDGGGSAAGSGGSAGAGDAGMVEPGSGGTDAGPGFPPAEPDDCITDPSAGAQTLTCIGQEIEFLLTVPETCFDEACGLILDVHGWVMDGPMEASEDDLNVLGPDNGYITIHPTATLNEMNQRSWRAGVDDPTLIDILERVARVFHVDPKRVHVTGFSQGGMMTWRLLCDYPELFGSVAPGAAATGYSFQGGICEGGTMPDPEVPILFLHGTDDALSPYNVAEMQRDTIVTAWSMTESAVVSTDAQHDWTRYENAAGTVFELLAHDYTSTSSFLRGHCFPGSDSGGGLACQEEAAFHWGEAALAFFMAHPKR